MSRNRDDVINMAGRLFAQRGFHGTSMRELGDELGLLGSSLYAHIGSKNELLSEIVQAGVQLCMDHAAAVDAAGGSASTRLAALVEGHVGIVIANRDIWTTFMNEYRFLPDAERDEVAALRDRYQGEFRRVLVEGIEAGEFRSNLDPRLTATFVLSVLNAVDGWYRPGGPRGPEEVAHDLLAMILEGVAA